MFTAKVKNMLGDSLTLFPGLDYAVTISGITSAKAAVNFSTAGINDGSRYNSSRRENRNIVLQIRPLRNVEKNRIALYRVFRTGKQVEFYFKNGSRDVFIAGYVEHVDGDLFRLGQSLQVSIICNDPSFKALHETVVGVSGVIPLFTFPFAIDAAGIPFSEIEKKIETNVFYEGEIESGIIIEMLALNNCSNPMIYSASGDSFKLDIDLIEGDTLIINTNPGEKSVTLNRGGAVINALNSIKEYPTWFVLQPGDNVFMYDASDPGALQITFKYLAKYEGV